LENQIGEPVVLRNYEYYQNWNLCCKLQSCYCKVK